MKLHDAVLTTKGPNVLEILQGWNSASSSNSSVSGLKYLQNIQTDSASNWFKIGSFNKFYTWIASTLLLEGKCCLQLHSLFFNFILPKEADSYSWIWDSLIINNIQYIKWQYIGYQFELLYCVICTHRNKISNPFQPV